LFFPVPLADCCLPSHRPSSSFCYYNTVMLLFLSLALSTVFCSLDDANSEEREKCKGERRVTCHHHHHKRAAHDDQAAGSPTRLWYKRSDSVPTCPTVPPDASVFRVAFVGDFGFREAGCETFVADAIRASDPHEVVTLGDNNYHHGECQSMHDNIAKDYHRYLGALEDLSCFEPEDDEYGSAAEERFDEITKVAHDTVRQAIFANGTDGLPRFWPVLGNHDVDKYLELRPQGTFERDLPYFQYFLHLNGSAYYQRHLDARWTSQDPDLPSVQLFALDSTANASMLEEQRVWVAEGLRTSTADYRIVVMHHAPFSSSGHHEPAVELRWPFAEWGASAVLAGHVHAYERVQRKEDGGMPYIVNGLGGIDKLYEVAICDAVTRGSQFRYDAAHGFVMAYFGKSWAGFCFQSMQDGVVDSFTIPSGRLNLTAARQPGPAPSAALSPTPAPPPAGAGAADTTVSAHSAGHAEGDGSSSSTVLLYTMFVISAVAVGVCAGVIASHRGTAPPDHSAEA